MRSQLALDAEDGAEGWGAGRRHREQAVERPRRVGGGAGHDKEVRGSGGQREGERERGAGSLGGDDWRALQVGGKLLLQNFAALVEVSGCCWRWKGSGGERV